MPEDKRFVCASGGQCVSRAVRCNGRKDCQDASDERACWCDARRSKVRCNDTSCVNVRLWCNGHADCANNADEMWCSDSDACPDGAFRCGHLANNAGVCLPPSYECNGIIDCPDYSDEANCCLYVYRFEVPIGEVYRFWLTWRQGPSKSPLDLGKFVDYAFSRVADDAICSKHLRQEDAFEVHLGEADYIALLRDGQCACAAAESSDVSAGDVCRRSRHHREDKSRGDEAVSRGDTGDESVGSFARGKSDADNYGCETERLDLATLFQENDCGGGKNGAPDVSSADHEATWSRGDVPTATRAATASKPASVGPPSQEHVNCRVAYSDSASSGYRAEVPKTSAADLSESEPGFTPDQSESEASASSAASSSDDDSPSEDANRTEGCRDGGPMTGDQAGKEMGGPDGDIWKTHTFEKCHRTSIRAKDAVNLLFAIVGEERTYIISSANERLTSALVSSPSQSLSADLLSDLMRLISGYESFRLVGRGEVGDRVTAPHKTDEAMDTVEDTVRYDEESLPEESYPDQPDSVPDQYFIDNDYRPINFPYESSPRSRDRSGDVATPVDITFGFDEIVLDSDGPSLTTTAAAVTDVPTTATRPDLASGHRLRSLLIADVPDHASTEPRRPVVLWTRARRAVGRLLRSVRGFFRVRFRFGRRRRSPPSAALRLALRSRDYQEGSAREGGGGGREVSSRSTPLEKCEDIAPELPCLPPPSARGCHRV